MMTSINELFEELGFKQVDLDAPGTIIYEYQHLPLFLIIDLAYESYYLQQRMTYETDEELELDRSEYDWELKPISKRLHRPIHLLLTELGWFDEPE